MSKKYVEVTAVFAEDGRIDPISIHWEDGRNFEIDRVVYRRKMSSLKAGSKGIRYTCMIMGQQAYLYHEENGRWFVEKKF